MHKYLKDLLKDQYKNSYYKYCKFRLKDVFRFIKYGVNDFNTFDLDEYSVVWLYEHVKRYYDLASKDIDFKQGEPLLKYNDLLYNQDELMKLLILKLEECLTHTKYNKLIEENADSLIILNEEKRLTKLKQECFHIYAVLLPLMWW